MSNRSCSAPSPTTRRSSPSGRASATTSARAGVDLDFALFSNYERQVEALLAGHIDIAWNTPLGARARAAAHRGPLALARHARQRSRLPRQDRRAPRRRHPLARRSGGQDAGRRQPRLDAGAHPAAALLARARASTLDRVQLLPFDTDLGKHGDTGTSELDVLRALRRRARAGRRASAIWSGSTSRPPAASTRGSLEVLWTTPGFDHCMFDALPTLAEAKVAGVPARALRHALGRAGAPAAARARRAAAVAAAARRGLRQPASRARRDQTAGEPRGRASRSTAATCRSAAACWRSSVRRSSCWRRAACVARALVERERARTICRRGAASSATSISACDAGTPDGRDRAPHRAAGRCRRAAAPTPAAAPARGRRRTPASRRAARASSRAGPRYPFTLTRARSRRRRPETRAALRPGGRGAVGRGARHSLGDACGRAAAAARARRRPGDDVPGRERAVGALRAVAVRGAPAPGLRRGRRCSWRRR